MKSFAKIIFLVITVCFFNTATTQAQCTPAASLPTWGIFPSALADGTINTPYSQVLQYVTNIDTVINDATYGNVQAKIDSVRILGVVGLPQGISYQCNKPKCMVNGGEIGCVILSGTCATKGVYPIGVIIKTLGRFKILGIWVATNRVDTNKAYSIGINWYTGLMEVIDNAKPVKAYPNPAQNILFIDAKTIGTETATIKLFDVSGKLMSEEKLNVFANPSIDISNLNAGLYFAEITNGKQTYRTKFVKN